jgi:hypothetical protein
MKTLLSGAWFALKVFIFFVLALPAPFLLSHFTKSTDLIYGSVLFFVLIVPGFFVLFFTGNILATRFALFWKCFTAFYILLLIGYVALIGWAAWRHAGDAKTQATVEFINSKKIVLYDVYGNNLPPQPDQALNDSTIEGIDANNNYIRDDVELAIFAKYPDSAKIRAAELQYAQALQLELTQVFDSGTLTEAIQKENLAYNCLGQSLKQIYNSDSNLDNYKKEIINIVLNTAARKQKMSNVFDYLTGHGYQGGQKCDIESSLLSN